MKQSKKRVKQFSFGNSPKPSVPSPARDNQPPSPPQKSKLYLPDGRSADKLQDEEDQFTPKHFHPKILSKKGNKALVLAGERMFYIVVLTVEEITDGLAAHFEKHIQFAILPSQPKVWDLPVANVNFQDPNATKRQNQMLAKQAGQPVVFIPVLSMNIDIEAMKDQAAEGVSDLSDEEIKELEIEILKGQTKQ